MQKWFVQGGPGEKTNGGIYYRQILPFRHCKQFLQDRGVEVTIGGSFGPNISYDAYFFQRTLSLAYLPIIIELKRRGKILVWDMDDDLFTLQSGKEPNLVTGQKDAQGLELAKLEMNALEICLGMADIITTITPALSEMINRQDKTLICPNLIDLDDHLGIPESHTGRVLVTGSDSHREDVMLIKYLYEETKNDLEWIFFGHGPVWMTDEATYIPWTQTKDYPRILRLIDPQWILVSLRENKFNESKSAIKVWEAGMTGANTIASNWGPYIGHPAAIVQPDEIFERADMDVCNWAECRKVAIENSWQFSEGRKAWELLFDYVASAIPDESGLVENAA